VIFIEQNFGPHMEQKCATLAPSCGRVSSWNCARRVRVEAEVELVFQRNSKRALRERVVAHLRAGMALGQVGRVGRRSCRR